MCFNLAIIGTARPLERMTLGLADTAILFRRLLRQTAIGALATWCGPGLAQGIVVRPMGAPFRPMETVRVKLTNRGGRRVTVYLTLQVQKEELVNGQRIQFFEDLADDMFARSDADRPHAFRIPGRGSITVNWDPLAQSRMYRPIVGRLYRIELFPEVTLEGGGPCYDSKPFRFVAPAHGRHRSRQYKRTTR